MTVIAVNSMRTSLARQGHDARFDACSGIASANNNGPSKEVAKKILTAIRYRVL